MSVAEVLLQRADHVDILLSHIISGPELKEISENDKLAEASGVRFKKL